MKIAIIEIIAGLIILEPYREQFLQNLLPGNLGLYLGLGLLIHGIFRAKGNWKKGFK